MALDLLGPFVAAFGSALGRKAADGLARISGSEKLRLFALHKRTQELFSFRGKVLVLVPVRGDAIAPDDDAAGIAIEEEFDRRGLKKNKDFEIRRISCPLDAADRRHNLVVLCGENPMWREIIDKGVLESVEPRAAVTERENRAFLWLNREFRWSALSDHALIAVKPNPYNPKRRVVMLGGLRSIGTKGAAQVVADVHCEDLRVELVSSYGRASNQLEAVLHVEHDQDRRNILELRIASVHDAREVTAKRRITRNEHALNRIYDSLLKYPRSLHVQDLAFTMVVTKDFGIRHRREFTWIAAGETILLQGVAYECDVPCTDAEFGLEPTCLQGGGDLVAIQALDDPGLKRFLLMPIPPLEPGNEPRRYRLESTEWPAAGTKLRRILGEPDRHTFRLPPHLARPINRVTLQVVFEVPAARFRVAAGADTDCTWDRDDEYLSGKPFQCTMENVKPGVKLEWLLTRIA